MGDLPCSPPWTGTSELGGLGGMVHLRGPLSALRLVSSAGLPAALALPWDIVDQGAPAASARVVREGHRIRVPAGPAGEAGPSTGMAAVPVFGRGHTVGALTVWTGARGEPTEEQWAFLRAVATWAEERMDQAPPSARPPRAESGGGGWHRLVVRVSQPGAGRAARRCR